MTEAEAALRGGRARVKICGVTSVADALLAVELGADYLGLNFYPASPRSVDLSRAVEIARAVAGRVPLVGVFVNRPPAEVEAIRAEVGLDLVQLHGDEGAAEVALHGGRAIKVFRRREPPAAEELASYGEAWGFLFDVPGSALYGGTGRTWSYGSVAGLPTGKPVLVAGGIGPANVRRALAESGAFGVDVCSGVESAPGVKDRQLLERLFREVGV